MRRFQNQLSLAILSGGQHSDWLRFENQNSIPDGDRHVSSYHSDQTGSGVHPVQTARGPFLNSKEGRGLKLTHRFHLMSNIRLYGAAYPLPPYASMMSRVDLAGWRSRKVPDSFRKYEGESVNRSQMAVKQLQWT
jgi:hypothetical protein